MPAHPAPSLGWEGLAEWKITRHLGLLDLNLHTKSWDWIVYMYIKM